MQSSEALINFLAILQIQGIQFVGAAVACEAEVGQKSVMGDYSQQFGQWLRMLSLSSGRITPKPCC